jgi:ferredoxin-type protein NapH
MRVSTLRKVTVAAAFVLVAVGLLFSTGTGTLSSFGYKAIAAICPLGVVESMLASKTIFPRALIVLGLAILFLLVFGKAFCSWLCPVPPLRGLFTRGRKQAKGDVGNVDAEGSEGAEGAEDSAGVGVVEASGNALLAPPITADDPDTEVAAALATAKSACGSGCTSCVQKRAKLDSRHLVLGGSLLSAALFGFPVFCLICPIGLTFGTIIIFWQWVGFNDISWSLLIYPVLLALELLVLRKWCARFCPLGALLSLMSLPNRFLRPKVDASKCLSAQGADCHTCCQVCPEGLDPHVRHGMNECSKCGLCLEKCPAHAITIPFLPKAVPAEKR